MIKSPDVYCTRTDTLGEPARARCIFFSYWSYGSPQGPKWKPIKSDIFHVHLHHRGCYGCCDTFTETWFHPPTLFPEIVSETKICKKKKTVLQRRGSPLHENLLVKLDWLNSRRANHNQPTGQGRVVEVRPFRNWLLSITDKEQIRGVKLLSNFHLSAPLTW